MLSHISSKYIRDFINQRLTEGMVKSDVLHTFQSREGPKVRKTSLSRELVTLALKSELWSKLSTGLLVGLKYEV